MRASLFILPACLLVALPAGATAQATARFDLLGDLASQPLAAALDASVSSPPLGPLRASLGARAVHDSTTGLRSPHGAVTAALSAAVGRGGVFTGAELRSGQAPGPVAGAWRSFRSLLLSVSASRHEDRGGRFISVTNVTTWDTVRTDSGVIVVPVHGTRSDTTALAARSWSQLEARARWSAWRLSLDASLGSRLRADSLNGPRTWGRLDGTLRLTRRVSLVMSAGRHPSPLDRVGSLRRFAFAGISLANAPKHRPLPAPVRPAAAAFTVQPHVDGMHRIAVRVTGARTVAGSRSG
jgi:hypothetical protein